MIGRSVLMRIALCLCAAAFAGCASLAEKDIRARSVFSEGRFDRAARMLDRTYGPDAEGKDRILFLLERGIILHAAADYRESNKYLLEAARLAEEMDIILLSEEAGAIITNENLRDYRPEDYERVLIHTYLAMNYALLGELEDGLVECRRAQTELYYIAGRRGEDFQWNVFTLYLSGLLYEALEKENDAFIDYRKVYEYDPELPTIHDDLLRSAFLMGYPPLYEEWREKLKGEAKMFPRDVGHVVLFCQTGQAPIKVPHHDLPVVPEPKRRYRVTDHGVVSLEGVGVVARTHPLYDIEREAVRDIEGRTAGLVAKRLTIMAAKEVGVRFAGKAVKDKYGHDVGTAIAWILRGILYALEQPDLRSWRTLPADLQIARFTLPPGRHTLIVRFAGLRGETAGEARIEGIEVKPGGWTFLNVRSVR